MSLTNWNNDVNYRPFHGYTYIFQIILKATKVWGIELAITVWCCLVHGNSTTHVSAEKIAPIYSVQNAIFKHKKPSPLDMMVIFCKLSSTGSERHTNAILSLSPLRCQQNQPKVCENVHLWDKYDNVVSVMNTIIGLVLWCSVVCAQPDFRDLCRHPKDLKLIRLIAARIVGYPEQDPKIIEYKTVSHKLYR